MSSPLGSISVLSFADRLSCGAEDGRRITTGASSRLDLLDLKGLEEDDAIVYMFVCSRGLPLRVQTSVCSQQGGSDADSGMNWLDRYKYKCHRRNFHFMGSILGVPGRPDFIYTFPVALVPAIYPYPSIRLQP